MCGQASVLGTTKIADIRMNSPTVVIHAIDRSPAGRSFFLFQNFHEVRNRCEVFYESSLLVYKPQERPHVTNVLSGISILAGLQLFFSRSYSATVAVLCKEFNSSFHDIISTGLGDR